MQREVREAACDPIDFDLEMRKPPPPLKINKQVTLAEIDQDWAKSNLFELAMKIYTIPKQDRDEELIK